MTTNALLISHDVIGKRMAGPGIRYFNLARVLAPHVNITLAIPEESPREDLGQDFAIVRYGTAQWETLAPHVKRADAAIFPSDIAHDMPQLAGTDAALVVDGYDPLLSEWLFIESRHGVEAQQAMWRERMRGLGAQYHVGDFFICASERQRDWWLGLLEAHGRVNARTFHQDPTFRKLIDLVPFGLPSQPPIKTRPVIKGVWDGIGPQDKVLLWGGGLWPWLDPLTAIRAFAKVWQQRPEVRLVFPGTKHPNPLLNGLVTHAEAARDLTRDLGLPAHVVAFGDWVPYEHWPDVLLESDLALSLHADTLEARLAYRSRMLDYIWAGLPTVATRGDATSELIEQHGLGTLINYHDIDAVAAAILHWLDVPREANAAQFAQAKQALTWERAAQPLIAFLKQPQKAADRIAQREKGEALGDPYALSQLAHMRAEMQAHEAAAVHAAHEQVQRENAENARLRKLVNGYEQGRFMRLMRRVKSLGRS